MKEKTEHKIICYKDITSKEIEWVWYPYLPKGKLVLLMGDPGCGKTYLTSYIASIISKGGDFVNGFPSEEGVVWLQNGEDGAGDTIKIRLEKMGAKLENITMVSEEEDYLSLQQFEKIKEIFEIVKPQVAIFDPLTLYVGRKVDVNSSNEIRTILSPISRLCEEFGVTLILVMHLNKSDKKALYKGLGSVDFMAIARSAIMITVDEKSNERKITHIKSSLAETGDELAFLINKNGELEWIDKSNSQVLNDSFISKTSKAKEKILEILEGGEKTGKELFELTTDVGAQKTIENARAELRKEGKIITYRKDNEWYWSKNTCEVTKLEY